MAEFKDYVNKHLSRLQALEKFFETENLTYQLDTLEENSRVNQELLTLSSSKGKENFPIFIFGFEFFNKDLEEQEFKRGIGYDYLSFRILRTYKDIKENKERVKVSDILRCLHDEEKDSTTINVYLQKIFSLAYYLDWDLEKDSNDIEKDYFIDIPDKFLLKPKQRFNYDITSKVYEDSNLFVFLNSKGKLNLVFKQLDDFTKEEIKNFVIPVIENIFNAKVND